MERTRIDMLRVVSLALLLPPLLLLSLSLGFLPARIEGKRQVWLLRGRLVFRYLNSDTLARVTVSSRSPLTTCEAMHAFVYLRV